MAQWLVRRTWDPENVESSTKHLTLQCLSKPKCINGNQQIAWGQPDKMLGGNLRWTSIPSRGSRNTPCRFILQKPQISAGTDEPSGSPNYYWGRLYLPMIISHELVFVTEVKRYWPGLLLHLKFSPILIECFRIFVNCCSPP